MTPLILAIIGHAFWTRQDGGTGDLFVGFIVMLSAFVLAVGGFLSSLL